MKRAILPVLLLFAFLTGFAQNRNICRLGITYDISQNDHWGKNKPVITSIIPYSPAELAGIKVNDIIMAIDGVQTADISSEEIGEMLNPAGKNEVLLTIGNLDKTRLSKCLSKKNAKKETRSPKNNWPPLFPCTASRQPANGNLSVLSRQP